MFTQLIYSCMMIGSYSSVFCECREQEPVYFSDILNSLQKRCGLVIPGEDTDWSGIPRMHIHVRRDKVLQDALKEVKKPRFDPTKLIHVRVHECASQNSFK